MNLEEWKEICRKAWEIDKEYLQTNRFAEKTEGRYSIRNCKKTTYTESTPETKCFRLTKMLYWYENLQELEKSNQLVLLQNQVQEIWLQHNLRAWMNFVID